MLHDKVTFVTDYASTFSVALCADIQAEYVPTLQCLTA